MLIFVADGDTMNGFTTILYCLRFHDFFYKQVAFCRAEVA